MGSGNSVEAGEIRGRHDEHHLGFCGDGCCGCGFSDHLECCSDKPSLSLDGSQPEWAKWKRWSFTSHFKI
jgi:hypothetical protein